MTTIKVAVLLSVAAIVAVSAGAQQRPRTMRPQAPAPAPTMQKLPAGFTEAAIRAHVIAPPHVQNIEMEEVDESREVRFKIPFVARRFKTTPKLDIKVFGPALHNALKDLVTGYIMQVRQNGTLVSHFIWNWAQTPADQNTGWNENARMHIASVSKFLTAVGMVKALDAKGLSYDTPIAGYLPTYWSKGPNINKITFRHLLTQTSGFSTDSSKSDYLFMKGRVAAGVSLVGSYDYENMNFGLCRILIPIVTGTIAKGTQFFLFPLTLNDAAWDVVTLQQYRTYMQTNVFTPAGVSNVGFAPGPGPNALAYPFPHNNAKGWNSGDLATVAGGAAWRLSAKELLNVMDHVRRRNTIIPAARAQYMLDNRFGIDQAIDSPAGKLYNKNGRWNGSGRSEQSVAYFLPNGMELAAFVNSPIGKEDFSLRGIVRDVFLNSLTD